jgi:hypothetical protein
VLPGDHCQTLRFGRQPVTSAEQEEVLDGTDCNLRAVGLTGSHESTFHGLFPTQLVDFGVGLAYHGQPREVEDVRLLGHGIDEHRAAKGVLAELVADQFAKAFENRFSWMHPDADLAACMSGK